MSTYPQKIKKESRNFFFQILIIGTVHLNVRITVRVRSFLRILCGVWTTTATTTVVVCTLLWCSNSLICIEPFDIVVYLVVTFLDNSNMASVEKLFEAPWNKKCMHAFPTILHIYLLKLL